MNGSVFPTINADIMCSLLLSDIGLGILLYFTLNNLIPRNFMDSMDSFKTYSITQDMSPIQYARG